MFNFAVYQFTQIKGIIEYRSNLTASNSNFLIGRTDTPWLDIAYNEIGVSECKVNGDIGSNPQILKYFYNATTDPALKGDQTAWCAAFVNWCLKQVGITGTNSSSGYSFLGWGQSLSKPAFGAIGIYDTGHVGFYTGEANGYVYFLGGNQGNMVKYTCDGKNCYELSRFKWVYPIGFTPTYNGKD